MKQFFRITAAVLAAAFLLALTGCAKKEHSEGKPKADLLATTQPVYQLTCALTDGTGLSVGLLISESVSCLHDYTLTVSQMEMIEQSGLVLESGLGLENFMEDVLRGHRHFAEFGYTARRRRRRSALVARPHAL